MAYRARSNSRILNEVIAPWLRSQDIKGAHYRRKSNLLTVQLHGLVFSKVRMVFWSDDGLLPFFLLIFFDFLPCLLLFNFTYVDFII
ncbi:unnamed protein product [Meloidogyne enterolobii]|uniref:Uncharacterized protein n=1 Tax=Meloidogyne enterolobii TaxID=390850 RepID=A0ACB0XK67_MELEN